MSPVKESSNNTNDNSGVVTTIPGNSLNKTSIESNKTPAINLVPIDGKNSTIVPGKRITRLQSKAIDSGKRRDEQSNNANANANGMSQNGGDVAKSHKRQRNKSTIPDNDAESTTYVAGKRNKRLVSTVFESRMEKSGKASKSGMANKSNATPAKRANRSMSCTAEISACVPSKRTKNSDFNQDPISRLIAVNCKLTNELLDSKKVLSEKNNSLLEMQGKMLQKELELVATKNLLFTAGQQVEMLEKKLKQLKAEQYCTDLIQLEDASTSQTDIHGFGSINSPQSINDGATNGATTSQVDLLSYDINFDEASDEGPISQQHDAISNETDHDGNDFQWTPTD